MERAAWGEAENVTSAVEREQSSPAFHALIRKALMVELLLAVLPVIPSQSGAVLVEACNRCLDHFAGFQGSGASQRVEEIDLRDGSGTIVPTKNSLRRACRTSHRVSTLRSMHPALFSLPTQDALAVTEALLAHADRLWRVEMRRAYGPDGALLYGFGPAGQGEPGSRIRQTYEDRRIAVAAWRQERRASN